MKLAYNVVNDFINYTADEIDFVIHIGQFQDNAPSVGGIDHRTVCEKINICKSNFYKIIKSLKNKEAIMTFGTEHDNWVFNLLNNQAFDEGGQYLNLNIELIHSKEFIALKRNEKIICLNLIKLSGFGKKEVCVTFKTLSEWTGAKLQSIKKYVHSLENLFGDKLRVEENKIYLLNKLDGHETKVENKKEVFNRRAGVIQSVVQKTQSIIYWCKKNKIKYETKEIEEAANLFRQYEKLIPSTFDKTAFFIKQVLKCIEAVGQVEAAYINKCISNDLKDIKDKINNEDEYTPSIYDTAFIPYDYCYNIEKLRNKISELLEGVCFDEGSSMQILKITIDNLSSMLNEKIGFTWIKKAKITFKQAYDKVLQVSLDKQGRPQEELFIEFIKEYVPRITAEASERLSKISNLETYLRTCLYDAMDKHISKRVIANN